MGSEEKEKIRLKRNLFNKYKADEVDSFIYDLRKKLKKLKAENAELLEKVKVLTDRLDAFKEKEESIRNALFMAEKLSSSCVGEAKEKAEKIILEAKARASEMMAGANCEAIEQKDVLAKFRTCVKDYRNKVLLLLKDHLETLRNFTAKDAACDELFNSVEAELDKFTDEKDISSSSSNFSSDRRAESATIEKNIIISGGDNVKNSLDSESRVKPVREKFKDLKFGENYSPGKVQKKSRFGIFKKVR